jgi:hypothetical protein
MVTQLYLPALGTHFSRLLRHVWATLGLSSGHNTESYNEINKQIMNSPSQKPSNTLSVKMQVHSTGGQTHDKKPKVLEEFKN